MLEKIDNISKNKSYKGRRHSAGFDKYFNKPAASLKLGKDSIRLSPAAMYLAALKYSIKEIEYPAEDIIGFDFTIGGFEIKTTINLSEFFVKPRQTFYLMRNLINNNDGSNKTVIKINVNKQTVKAMVDNNEISTNVFSEFFGRIDELKINNNLDLSDSSFVGSLKEGYENKLFNTFSTILNNLYTFIYRHEKYSVPNQFKFDDNDFELISIEEISRIFT